MIDEEARRNKRWLKQVKETPATTTSVFLVEVKRGTYGSARYQRVFATRAAAATFVAEEMTTSVCDIRATITRHEVQS